MPSDEDLKLRCETAVALVSLKRPLLADAKLEVSEFVNMAADELTLKLEKLIYTSPLGILEVEYPAGPWEHFRAVYFKRSRLGRWFLRRKPVRMHYERRSAAVAFPESTRVFPDDLGKPIILIRGEQHDYHH